MSRPVREGFGRLMRHRRLDLGIGCREMADRIGVDPTYLSKVERGKQTPSRKLCRGLADELDLPRPYVLGMAGMIPREWVDAVDVSWAERMEGELNPVEVA